MLPKGKIVTVYEDPISENKPEGNARIVRCIQGADASGLGLYEVNFIGDDPRLIVTRHVKEPVIEWSVEEVLEREG